MALRPPSSPKQNQETLRKHEEKRKLLSLKDERYPQTLAFVFLRLNGVIFGAIWTFHFDPMAKIRSETQHWKKTDFWTARRALLSARRADHFFGFARSARTTLETKTAKFSSARRALFSARRALPCSLHTVF